MKPHPNKLPFKGVLALVDTASRNPVSGSRGHNIILTHFAAQEALSSLIGMAINYGDDMISHDPRRKVGIITSAHITPWGSEINISGYLFARDFPELITRLNGGEQFGMSFELVDVRIANTCEPVWKIIEATFVGATVLLRSKASFEGTWFAICAQEIFV